MLYVQFDPYLQIILLLFLHWLGDFAFQTDAMATKKSKSVKWLTIHVSAYSGVLLVGGQLLFPWYQGITYTLINALLHGVTDFFTSKVTAYYYEIGNQRLFFTSIGFDQFIHGATLVGTFYYLQHSGY